MTTIRSALSCVGCLPLPDTKSARLDQDTPDLILSDLEMPELDGFSLYRQLRARGCQTPFIGMSGRLCEADGGESRFDAFLPKPFRMQTLIDTVEGVLTAQPVF